MFKIKIKDYWLHIVMGSILIIISFLCVLKFYHNEKEYMEIKNIFYSERCTGPEEDRAPKETCEVSNPNYKHSFFSNLTSLIGFSKFPKGLDLVLIIMIPACYITCRYLKSKIVFNELARESYNRVKQKIFLRAYSSTIPFILILITLILICYSYNSSFISESWESGLTFLSPTTMSKPITFLILYIAINILQSLFFVNIVLIICRKHHKFFSATLLSLLVLIGIELFLEIPFEILICNTLLKIDYGISFHAFGGLTVNDAAGMPAIAIFNFLLFIISFLIMLKSYKNKEQFINYCESDK